jgi:hypothetical protein
MMLKGMRHTQQLTNAFSPLTTRLFASQLVQVDSVAHDLQRNDETLLVKQPWTTRPFLHSSDINMPVFHLKDGSYTGEQVSLDHQIYNLPLRRDIVKNVFDYWQDKDRYILKKAKGFGEVAGSGIKPVPQKGRGAAR